MNEPHHCFSAIAADLKRLKTSIWNTLADYEYHVIVEATKGPDLEERYARIVLDRLQWEIETLAARLEVYADAMSLPSVAGLVERWRRKFKGKQLRKVEYYSDDVRHGFESRAFSALRPVVDAMITVSDPAGRPEIDAVLEKDLARLERALRSTAKLCHGLGIYPQSERDVQEVINRHLQVVFPDYTTKVSIDKSVLGFKPDGAIPSLQVAIEIKFVSSEDEVSTALHGLHEDVSGYAGDPRWTRFYSLVYMTEPFATEDTCRRALGASGKAQEWTVIVVTGPGGRPYKRATKRKPTRSGVKRR